MLGLRLIHYLLMVIYGQIPKDKWLYGRMATGKMVTWTNGCTDKCVQYINNIKLFINSIIECSRCVSPLLKHPITFNDSYEWRYE